MKIDNLYGFWKVSWELSKFYLIEITGLFFFAKLVMPIRDQQSHRLKPAIHLDFPSFCLINIGQQCSFNLHLK